MIAVLAPHVIDQIAAGEVIERPASVVKELVENAIDAGATTIAIEVAAGGRALVRVSDDGCGMGAKAAVLALERHATSKLREVDDLWGITSMGFRGEALPSIASVSKMTLTTRRSGDDAATRIVIEAGRLASVADAGAPVGTTVEVTDLLYNVPARLKFLKGEATEASHVTEFVGKIAMAYPRLHLRLKHNGRTALDVPPDRDGFARAQALLGPRVAARLIPVTGEESGVRVTAYLGAPELAQTTARGVQLFVGRRPVRDRGLLHALAMGYGELVPRGRYPIAVVLVDVPAGAVDVNVHPQKLEVRFSDAAVVAAALRHVVQAGVGSARWRDEAGGAGPVQMIASVAPPLLPMDGRAATPLAERHVAQMRSRQVSLGFAAPVAPPAAPPGARGPARARGAGGVGSVGVAGSPGFTGSPGSVGRTGSPSAAARDWARTLRDQTRASRAGEPRSGLLSEGDDLAPGAPSAEQAWTQARPGAGPVRFARSGSSAEPSTEPLIEASAEASAEPSTELSPGPLAEPLFDAGYGLGDASEVEAPLCSAAGSTPRLPLLPGGLGRPLRAGESSATAPGYMAMSMPGIAAAAGSAAASSSGSAAATSGSAAAASLGSSTDPIAMPAHAATVMPTPAAATPTSVSTATPAVGADATLTRPPAEHASSWWSTTGAPRADAGHPAATHGYFSQLHYLGQLDLTYLACEGDGEFVLVDQHAAHERVELARLRERHAHGTGEPRVAVQNMLFPVTLDATPPQLELVARVGDLLAQVGFEVEPFGKATLAVKAVPAGIRHGDPAQLLRALLQEWAEDGAPSEAERLDALLGEIACHSVVRAGDRLTPSEAETLLRSLDGVDLSLPAPHGRAVLLRLPLSEIGRRFGR